MDSRIKSPRKVLRCLHSAYQGVDSMKAHSNDSVYWPCMNASIRNFRANSLICATTAPSQLRGPITAIPSPEWPFQQTLIELFYVGYVAYLANADRLTGWLILYHLQSGHVTISKLMSICQQLFHTHMAPQWNSVAMVEHLLHPAYSSGSLRHGVWSTDCLRSHISN